MSFQLITAPEVISVLPELPVLGDLVNNLYDCHYAKFFVALGTCFLRQHYVCWRNLADGYTIAFSERLASTPTATLEQTYLLPSRLLSPHTRYYVREMRILAYGQLLESYRSVTLESLSGAFGVSVDFIDRQVNVSF